MKVCFGPGAGNCEQAFQADGIERTISISSMREKSWKRENHRAGLFPGRTPRYKVCVRIDDQLSTVMGLILGYLATLFQNAEELPLRSNQLAISKETMGFSP
jgi:hypothetical protein